ncbi:MAG: glycosyltransferase [Clostridia bacterium]|nr:glycosyltransferase [Clostridia bacterium]
MKVSVIVPCYNAERYLSECLRSVLEQTVRDIEVLVIDDGSTDGTLDIARRFEAADARVSVLCQENRGVCAARNAGLRRACGEYVTFVDADDLLVSGALSSMLKAARESEADLVVCAHETFDEAGNAQAVWPQTRWMDRRGEARRRAVALRLIEGDSVLNIMCNKLHRRSLLERERIRLDEHVRIAEDALFNLEAVLCGSGVAYVHEITYRYRMHAQSATHRETGGAFDTHRPWLEAMRRMLERRGVLGAYYPAYVDTVVLRLYKDGGVGGVVRDFAKAAPLLLGERPEGLTLRGRALWTLVQTGAFPAAYVCLFPAQVIQRKAGEAAFALRARKERPR